ncbi:aquaporin-like protein, partial [Syncephalis pseudoplumigaleata]
LRAFRRCQHKYRDYLGEFMATLVFLILGLAVNAQYTLWSKATDSFAACYGWGFAIVCGVYVGRRISSAHLNPAVTLSLYLFRGFPGRKVAGYCVAQLLGAFLATAVVYGCFRSGLDKFDGGIRQWQGEQATSNIFYVHPRPEVSFANHFLSEFVGSCILMIVICAVSDRHNNHDSDIVLPISLGFTVASVLLSLGYSTGLSINPARDIGPRLFGLCVYGSSAFSNNHYYFWVPTVAAFVGAPAGCLLYDLFVPSTP